MIEVDLALILQPPLASESRILSAETVVESGSLECLRAYVQREAVISFRVISGLPARETGLVARQVDARDLVPRHVVLGHLRGRTLSVAAAKFADQLANSLERFAAELNGG